jgi:hypothetical protein
MFLFLYIGYPDANIAWYHNEQTCSFLDMSWLPKEIAVLKFLMFFYFMLDTNYLLFAVIGLDCCGWDLAEWLELDAKVVTVLGTILASSDTVESERRQMKQC